jgi:CubicO group peptidase (beta-lactamase class C family)
VVVIGRRDSVLYAEGFGGLTWERNSPAPSPARTLWDLASLTKVVATSSATMVLVDQGRVALDAPVARYLPRFTGENRERVTVRMLLDHTSGLPAYIAFHRLAANRGAAIDMLYRQPLMRQPGAASVYSDLNAILLGLLVEAVSAEPLDVFTSSAVLAPLGLTSTRFMTGLPAQATIAPGRMVSGRPAPGRVDDDNAFLFGGVAGHAGLFSTGDDLARFAQSWLRQGSITTTPWVHATTMREFLSRRPESGTRLLGWDTPDLSGGPSVFGSHPGPRTYGHTGWTGTMLWIDPVKDLFVVFLTNRSLQPKVRRSLTALRDFRSSLSDLALSASER